MKRLQIPQKLVYGKFYVHEIAAVDLSKIYFLKNAKKTFKPNNRDWNRDWISLTWFQVIITYLHKFNLNISLKKNILSGQLKLNCYCSELTLSKSPEGHKSDSKGPNGSQHRVPLFHQF